MQLRHARLCLNCEEVHSASHCPVCTSESFAYVSRWIPPDERRQSPRTGNASDTPDLRRTAPASRPHVRWVKRGAAGVALLALSRVAWQLSRPVEWNSADLPQADEEPQAEDRDEQD